MSGTVYLVGAGCGNPDLITWKGLRLLRACDAVLYDDLSSPSFWRKPGRTAKGFLSASVMADIPCRRRKSMLCLLPRHRRGKWLYG